MRREISIAFVLTALSFQGCASAPKVLSVKSDPADAEVCIKGKRQSEFFKQEKHCIGSTPLEVDSVTVTDGNGKKRVVKFNEIDSEKEQFYLLVSRPGYAPQAVTVPSWDHYVTLRQEGGAREIATSQPAPSQQSQKGNAKISSNPVGALVYVNDFLKGNTPFVLEGENGQTIRLKIEQAGYKTIERSITMESGKNLEINLSMEKQMERVVAAQTNKESVQEVKQ